MLHHYLMENEEEGKRLSIKGDQKSTREQLLHCRLTALQNPIPTIVDAGCGVGFVSSIMRELLVDSYAKSRLLLLDGSQARLDNARENVPSDPQHQTEFIPCALESIPVDSNSASFVFSRFVFEYLKDPALVFDELVRITAPGGKIVVGDLDNNCMLHYPLPEGMEPQVTELFEVLRTKKLLDPYIGRKLFSFFHAHQLQDIKVTLWPHHMFYGKLSAADEFNWNAKLEQLQSLVEKEQIRLSFDFNTLKERFMKFILEPSRFSYTPLILVEGTKK